MGTIENGMVVGADDYQAQRQRISDRVDQLADQCYQEFLADDGSIEEAISDNADLIHEAVKVLRDGGDVPTFLAAFDKAVETYLRPQAETWANREIYRERGLA
jgi:hypothetical protein